MDMEKKNTKNPVGRMALLIISILLIFGGAIFLYSTVLSSIKTAEASELAQAQNSKFELIWTKLELSLEESYASSTTIAEHIENSIKEEFDLDELKDAMDRRDADTYKKISALVAANIENITLNDINNYRNSVLVMTGDGIILEDYTVDLSTKVPSGENFEKYLDTAYNKELFATALRRLKVHSKNIIATENIDYTNNENHIKVSKINKETLREVFLAEGLSGLQNYSFLTPVYITDNGDIFGTKDIVAGIPQENHKFVIIQTFNLYDQIMRTDHEYIVDDYTTAIQTKYNNVFIMLYSFGIVLVIAIVACILYIMSLYNFITDRYEHDSTTT